MGLGKLGLPLAIQFALAGLRTWGYDIDKRKIDLLSQGICEFREPDLTEHLPELLLVGSLIPTSDLSTAMGSATHVVLVVPLETDEAGTPIYAQLDKAAMDLSSHLKVGQTVIIETTVPVGTTRNRIAPLLEKESGLKAGLDFHLAFSPERVSSGNMKDGFSRYPKLVGGITKESAFSASRLYERAFSFTANPSLGREVGVWILDSCEAAEFSKLAETTYRDVNLALANTFALACVQHGIDYLEVVEACNSQPFSFLHNPGISIGGHCIPVYPHLFLSNNEGLGLVEVARSINESMPKRMVRASQLASPTNSGARALVIGLCYRTGVKETAHSGAFSLRSALEDLELIVQLSDELFSDVEISAAGFQPLDDSCEFEIVFINSGSEAHIRDVLGRIGGSPLVVDGRRTLEARPPKRYLRL